MHRNIHYIYHGEESISGPHFVVTLFLENLMLNKLDLVRYTVGKITPVQRREVRASDFGPRASFWMNFPKEGSQLTPPHQSEDFKWKDYCPMVFR